MMKNEQCMEMAKAHLRQSEYSISEIAYLLHYSEPSAFHSAFKKWTGQNAGTIPGGSGQRIASSISLEFFVVRCLAM